MRYRYLTADVFTDRPFGGNPLAVFPDARGLPPERMQQIARELNLSETVFVVPPSRRGSDPCRWRSASQGMPVFAQLTAAQLPEQGPPAPSVTELAAPLSLAPEDVLEGLEGKTKPSGVSCLFITVRNREALGRTRLRLDHRERMLAGDMGAPRVVYREPELLGSSLRSRMFAPAPGNPRRSGYRSRRVGALAARPASPGDQSTGRCGHRGAGGGSTVLMSERWMEVPEYPEN